jgi:phosphoglycerate dehydrogenase-like enzyme
MNPRDSMNSTRLRIVASGDYMYLRAGDSIEEMGFGSFLAEPRVGLDFLPAAPQSDAIPDDALKGADALLMLGQYLRAPTIAAAADTLLAAGRAGAGTDKMDVDACTRHGVIVFNVPDALTEATAAGALALLLAAARNLAPLDRLTRTDRWDDRVQYRGLEIYRKTLGIIGPGRIGGELIRLMAPFDMRMLAYSPRLTAARAAAKGAEAVPLATLMAESDFVVVCCPLTPETEGLLSATEIARMKPTAIIVNVGRGPVIDEDALVHALQERRIAGAALDVFTVQPLPKDDPLTRLDNVLLCPHFVCNNWDLRGAVPKQVLQGFLRLLEGELPENIVNPEVLAVPAFRAKHAALAARFSPSTRPR